MLEYVIDLASQLAKSRCLVMMFYSSLPFLSKLGPRPHSPRDQRKHKLQSCDVVHIRGFRPPRHDPRTGLLPQEVL